MAAPSNRGLGLEQRVAFCIKFSNSESISTTSVICKICSAMRYAATAHIYQPATVATMELSTAQCILLSLLHGLVIGDVAFCNSLVSACFSYQQLRSTFLKVWLKDDFIFDPGDIKKGLLQLDKLVSDGTLDLPDYIFDILISLGRKYDVSLSSSASSSAQEAPNSTLDQLYAAVINNSGEKLIALASRLASISSKTNTRGSLLLEGGISVIIKNHLRAHLEKKKGLTPLHAFDIQVLRTVIAGGVKVNNESDTDKTSLHIVSNNKNSTLVEALLYLGSAVYVQDCDGDSPLSIAIKYGKVSIVRELLAEGVKTNVRNKKGWVPLHHAAVAGSLEAVTLLLEVGAIVDARDNEGLTPAHRAAIEGKLTALQLLVHCGADVNSKSNIGNYLLNDAAYNGRNEVVLLLLEAGVDLEEGGSFDRTPLMSAVCGGCVETVLLLLDQGVNITSKNINGWTSLHYAVFWGYLNLVILLIDKGSEINVKNDDGMTPLHLALERNHTEVVKFLKRKGAHWLYRLLT